MLEDSDDEEGARKPCCSPELKKSNALIVQNIGACLLAFYCIYYATAALMHGVFHVEAEFDGRQPFNFFTMSDFNFSSGSMESIASFLAMELTYLCTTLIISFYLTSRIWDYAVTITFIHILLSCAVMMDFPESWQWWCALAIGLLWMITMGECISFLLRRRNARRVIGQSLNLPPSAGDKKEDGGR